MSVLERLGAISDRLGELELKAILTKAAVSDMEAQLSVLDVAHSRVTALTGAVEKASITISATASTGDRDLSALHGRILAVGEQTGAIQRVVMSGSSEMADRVERDSRKVEESIDRAATRTHQVSEELARTLEAALSHAPTRLEDLEAQLDRFNTAWGNELRLFIDAVQVGARDVKELITLWGNAQLGGERLREFLKGLNLKEHQDRVNALISAVVEGQATLEQVVVFIGDTNLAIAARLRDTIKQFQEGKVTLQALLDLLAEIKRNLPNEQFGQLAEALRNALIQGGLS